MITLEMTRDEANFMRNVLERYIHHLQVETSYTNKWQLREAMKQREEFLSQIIERLKALILEEPS